jgi:CyaY protein
VAPGRPAEERHDRRGLRLEVSLAVQAKLDESTYQKLVGETFRAIEDRLADVDPDVVELTSTGDMLTLQFASGVKCILNTQRAVHQIWMAARANAWHFSWGGQHWLDDKGRGELWPILAGVVKELSGQELL